MKAIVDKDTCTGCSLCADACPEVFEMNGDGVAQAIETEVTEQVADSAREAMENCPVSAIEEN